MVNEWHFHRLHFNCHYFDERLSQAVIAQDLFLLCASLNGKSSHK